MIVHLIDGTYELFRHFYGLRRFHAGADPPFGAVLGVLNTLLKMIEDGATHVGVATDHVIESFRNALWPGYKTGDGIDPALWAQFHPLEEALTAMGVRVWPMVEQEADDALAAAAQAAAADPRTQKVCIWTPTRIWRSACAASAWSRSTAGPTGYVTRRAYARSLASSRRASRTFSRSWGTVPMATRELPAWGA